MSFLINSLVVVLMLAQPNYTELLKEDVVSFSNGKMTLEGYGIIMTDPSDVSAGSIQVKYYAEATADDFISRDNFISISSMIFLPIFLEIGQFSEIEEPIGNVDLEINIFMTKGGLQIEVKNNMDNTSNRNTVSWQDIFEQ